MHRRQTQDLTPLPFPQLLPDHTVQPTPDRLATLVDQDARIVGELHDTTVGPLVLLRRAHDNGVANVAAADLVGGRDGDTASRAGFGAEVALFLDDDDDAIACGSGRC